MELRLYVKRIHLNKDDQLNLCGQLSNTFFENMNVVLLALGGGVIYLISYREAGGQILGISNLWDWKGEISYPV